MYRTGISMVVGALLALGAAAQSQTGAEGGAQAQAGASSTTSAGVNAQNGQANAGLASGTAFNAELGSALDSKKCKPGDAVTARTTEAVKSEGKTVIPRGAKLVGHVTEASSHAKGESESTLGIVFDKAILKNGQTLPLDVAIRALAAAENGASMAGDEMEQPMEGSSAPGGMRPISSAGGAVGAVTNTAAKVGGAAGGTVNSAASAGGSVAGASREAVGGLNAAGRLTSNSQGVFGLNGLNLSAAGSNATQGSVITSAGRNVHLDSGTRMLLVTQAQAGTAGESKHAAEGQPNPQSKARAQNPEKP